MFWLGYFFYNLKNTKRTKTAASCVFFLQSTNEVEVNELAPKGQTTLVLLKLLRKLHFVFVCILNTVLCISKFLSPSFLRSNYSFSKTVDRIAFISSKKRCFYKVFSCPMFFFAFVNHWQKNWKKQ